MADSRRIIRSPGQHHVPTNSKVPRTIVAPPAQARTMRRRIDAGTADDPEPILQEDPTRRGAVVYNPADDLDGGGAQGLVWVGYEDGDGDTFFPLEPGGIFEPDTTDWVFAWSPAGSTLYIAEGRD